MSNPKKKSIFQELTFHAQISPTNTAIHYPGDCGARFSLDVAEIHLGEFAPILAFRNKRLVVTIKEDK